MNILLSISKIDPNLEENIAVDFLVLAFSTGMKRNDYIQSTDEPTAREFASLCRARQSSSP